MGREDRDTRAVFGDYIHIYDMQQAKEDGATVAIYFESRLAKLSLKSEELPLLDDEVDELAEDEIRFYDALVDNESAVRELSDEILKKIAHELTENLRQNLSVDWSQRESVRAKLRLMVKRILRKYKYPPDMQDAAVELVLQQAQALGEAWMV